MNRLNYSIFFVSVMLFLLSGHVFVGASCVQASEPVVSITGMTITPSGGTIQPGDSVDINITASATDSAPVYYKFYYCGNYGTDLYSDTEWTVVRNYSASGSCRYVFPNPGHYVVVARVVTDPDREPSALPIIGGVVTVGGTAADVNISSYTTTSSPNLTPGDSVTVSATASTHSGTPIYYEFYYCANYGTSLYDSTPWTPVKKYSSSNSAIYTFPDAGNYIAVVRAVTNPLAEPAALPIAGSVISVNDSAFTECQNGFFWHDWSCLPDSVIQVWGLGYDEKYYYHTDRNYDWYIDQADTGVHADNNCGPTTVTMAAKWNNRSFSRTAEDARNMYRPSGGWWYTDDIINYLNYYHIQNETSWFYGEEQIAGLVDDGYIVILCLDMSYIERNYSPEQRTGRFYSYDSGHFLIVKGARKIDDQLYFEVYDPNNWHMTYSDGSEKGKNRYYRAEELSMAVWYWWEYLIIVYPESYYGISERAKAGEKWIHRVDPDTIKHAYGR
jgi:hypothetical protein